MKSFSIDPQLAELGAGVFALLLVASITGLMLKRAAKDEKQRDVIANLNARINAWWVMIAIFFLAMATGGIGSVILFGLTSFLALREYITLTPASR
jgi:phosphatidate cytidylyltransferase